MANSNYNQVNTLIDTRFDTLLTESDFTNILGAQNSRAILRLLEDTRYHFQASDLEDFDQIENQLNANLIESYRFAFQEAPNPKVVEIFAAKYIYHNLKILFKKVTTANDLDHLLIPVGRYSYDELTHVIQTQESTVIPKKIVDRIRLTWNDYQNYQDIEAINIGMDMAYFDHLRDIANEEQNEVITNLVNALIDFYNIISVKRSMIQNKPRSFIFEVLTEKGTLSIQEFIQTVQNDEIANWFKSINAIPFVSYFDEEIQRMEEGQITVGELENLETKYIYRYLSEEKLNINPIVPLLLYLYRKEMEVINLRLVLNGRLSGLPEAKILERMRPVYDK